jgi:hypothetical protein
MRKFVFFAVWLGVTMVATSVHAGRLFATENTCGDIGPLAAATNSARLYPKTLGVVTECPLLCTKWVGVCKSLVSASAACHRAAASKETVLNNATCETIENEVVQHNCLIGTNGFLRDFLLDLKYEVIDAKASCESRQAECERQCEAP